jgi:hypothetical protein
VLLRDDMSATLAAASDHLAALPQPRWLPEQRWQAVCFASAAVPALAALPESLAEQPDAWQAVYEADQPHAVPLPGIWCLLNDVQHLVLLRALRQAAASHVGMMQLCRATSAACLKVGV